MRIFIIIYLFCTFFNDFAMELSQQKQFDDSGILSVKSMPEFICDLESFNIDIWEMLCEASIKIIQVAEEQEPNSERLSKNLDALADNYLFASTYNPKNQELYNQEMDQIDYIKSLLTKGKHQEATLAVARL